LTYTPLGRGKNQQTIEMEIIKENQEALKWLHLMNECKNLFKRPHPFLELTFSFAILGQDNGNVV